MVPLIWAFFSADVNAGTASAARIAIIAITTSNSMRVNAEEIFVLIFMWVFFSFCWVPPSSRSRGATTDKCSEGRSEGWFILGFLFCFGLRFPQSLMVPKIARYRRLHGESQYLFLTFFGGRVNHVRRRTDSSRGENGHE